MIIVVVAAKKGFLVPKQPWDFPVERKWPKIWKSNSDTGDTDQAKMSFLKAWYPYLLIAIIHVVTRIPPFGLKDFLADQQLTLNNVAGIDGLDYILKWAYLPGTIPFILVALFTQWHHKMPLKEIKKS
ncbi:hypothetical protein GCM10009433_09940 [Psychroflexus lacisalsi]|jgi:lactate permease|uniref:Uncharacterized protein n=2 Tax=Psychroflexus lacisalsi TaxID=503928 RepID=A0ABP3VD80_9FLAO